LDKYRNTRPLDFRTILVQLQEKTGRLDKFFASKIIATLDQNQVIIDSIVLGELSLKVRKDINPIDSAVEIYTSISQINSAAIKQEKFITLKSKLAKIVNLEKISDVKLFDMLLWLSIERKSKEKLSL
jgi:GTP:adenosylcobinamide-phosphate guanylyltransferase